MVGEFTVGLFLTFLVDRNKITADNVKVKDYKRFN